MVKKKLSAKMLFVALSLFSFSLCAFAQNVEEVTLTVSGDGATKKEATDIALRSAVEQAFGVFVSANTTVLNDALVKDEIATVSSGNIKKYEEITSLILPNGNSSVTLKAIVSISKLAKFAESHGSSVEFAGSTFGANMKLKELNKANEEKAIENMVNQIKALATSMFDYKLEMGEPKLSRNGETYLIDSKVYVYYNDNTEIINSLFLKTLSSLTLSDTEINDLKELNFPYCKIDIGNFYFNKYSDSYVPKIINFKKPIIYENAYYNTNFLREYITASFDLENIHKTSSDLSYKFRSKKSIYQIGNLVNSILSKGVLNFSIKDNLGNSSMVERTVNLVEYQGQRSNRNEFDVNHRGSESYTFSGLITSSTQPIVGFRELEGWLFTDREYQADFIFKRNIFGGSIAIPHLFKDKLAKKDGLPICYVIDVKMNIPKEDISKYSKFTIERKQSIK